MGRAPCCEKVGLKKGRWTADEDEKLAKYIAAHGEGSWRSLPKNAGLLRCGKSCRLRWMNYLRADLKRGDISKEEEEVIIKLHSTLGNRWSLIATHLPGRTDNEIKNYWNSHLSRRLHSFRRIGVEGEIVTMLLDKIPSASRRRGGGRTSRWAMKKNQEHENSSHGAPNNVPHVSDGPDPDPSRDSDGAPGPEGDTGVEPPWPGQEAEGGPPTMNGGGDRGDGGEMWQWLWDGTDDWGDLGVMGTGGCGDEQLMESFDCWLTTLEGLLN